MTDQEREFLRVIKLLNDNDCLKHVIYWSILRKFFSSKLLP